MSCGLLLALCLVVQGPDTDSQQEPVDVWNTAALTIDLSAERASGPGLDWLEDQSQQAQYVMIGEQHGLRGVADLARHLYGRLQPGGFDHLALEMGPWIGQRMNSAGVDAAIAAAPFSVAFDSNADLELMRAALTTDPPGVICGLDQASNVIHLLQRLVEIAPDPFTASAARGLQLKAALRGGEYSRQQHAEEISRLRERFGNPAEGEAAEVFDAIEATMEIFYKYRQGVADKIDPRESAELRESYMLERFLACVQAADNPPKMLFKMGGAHTMRGIGPNGIATLGERVSHFAAQSNHQILTVSMRGWNAETSVPPQSMFGEADVALIDTAKIRAELTPEQLADLPETLRRDLDGFDALIYVRNPQSLSHAEIQAHKDNFRSGMINHIIRFAVPAAILLLWVLCFLLGLFRGRNPNKEKPKKIPGLRLALFLCASLVIGILAWQMSVLLWSKSDGAGMLATSTFSSVWMPAILASGIVAICLLLGAVFKEPTAMWRRVVFGLACVSHIALVAQMWYWNLGGMLAG